MKRDTLKHKKEFIETMNKTLGNITAACDVVGISRQTYYKWLESDSWFKTEIENISASCLDFVETKLKQLIREGNPTATIFYLKTRGRERGYTEKQEIVNEQSFPTLNLELAGGDDEN